MKYCTHCGSEIDDEAVICVHCGCDVSEKKSSNTSNSNSLGKVALIFMILGCVFTAIGGVLQGLTSILANDGLVFGIILTICSLLPLAWGIPMIISFKRKLKNGEPVSTGFKVCTLLFVNIVAGILMLCMPNENN